MARFNEVLAGRFNRFTQKHFSMKGRQGTPTISADIQMGMDYHSGEESRVHEAWNLYARSVSGAAIVGQLGEVELRNPPTSGVIAVVTYASWIDAAASTAVAQPFFSLFRGATTDQNAPTSSAPIDRRSLNASSTLQFSQNTGAPTAPGGTNLGAVNAGTGPAANSTVILVPPVLELPLLPGDAFLFQGVQANSAYSFSIWWRERALEDSEKT
jgi:hypothetical protein